MAVAPIASLPTEGPDAAGLLEDLRTGGPTLVALSGGVDSAVVAHLAHRALGDRARAATLVGPAVPPGEVDRATSVAQAIGIAHVLVPADPLTVDAYRANPANRCYFCRQVEASALRAWGTEHGIARYVDGLHADDVGDDRPGIRAMDEAGVSHPLLRAGWRKPDVRRYARAVGLPNADAPSDACLASRIARGAPISLDRLGRVALAEERLRAKGFVRVRVRTDGVDARVEVDPAEVPRLLAAPLAASVVAELRELGYARVTLDEHGYRTRAGA